MGNGSEQKFLGRKEIQLAKKQKNDAPITRV